MPPPPPQRLRRPPGRFTSSAPALLRVLPLLVVFAALYLTNKSKFTPSTSTTPLESTDSPGSRATTSSNSLELPSPMEMLPVSGTYWDLVTLFPLPKELLRVLLPEEVYADLLPAPESYGLQVDEHPLVLHLGRQHTGPPFFRFWAQEAKLEVPFVAAPGSTIPSVYKHSLWSDTWMITTSGRITMGLKTEKAAFEPAKAPLDDENKRALGEEGGRGRYEVTDRVSWEGQREAAGATERGGWEGADEVLRTTEMWWFGAYAGGTLCRFPFNHTRGPIPFRGTIRLHLPSLKLGSAPLPGAEDVKGELREGTRIEGEWLVLDGVRSWSTEAGWKMIGPKRLGEVKRLEGL